MNKWIVFQKTMLKKCTFLMLGNSMILKSR